MKQLTELRALMAEHKVDALIVPGTDPHASEYIAAHWQERNYVSAFTGSAGTAVITLDGGCLWTDSRYFLQASEQLKLSGLTLQKDGEIGTPTINQWLKTTLGAGKTVAINPDMISINGYKALENELKAAGLNIYTEFDFVNAIWTDRPAMPQSKAVVFDETHCGQSTADKLTALRTRMADAKANTLLITALDDIAWLFNLRGADIDYNPVLIAFGLVTDKDATLFINPDKLTDEVRTHLAKAGVKTDDYTNIKPTLSALAANTRIAVDPVKCNYALYKAIPAVEAIIELPSPVFRMKCIKNAVELAGVERAMRKDGVALVRFWMWLEKAIANGEKVTELSAIDKLHECRAEQEGFLTESFNTIAGYGPHGAIVHYAADEDSNIELKAESFFLLDSGGQYYDGTTDITRTVALGNPTAEMKADYTLVLKGHLALGHQLFPYGTRGAQLDVLARCFLWNAELQYGHGTGHGLGHCLNVHEGPQSIRMDENPTILEPGMLLSNEPGLYRAGKHGIRIENIVAVADYDNNVNEFGRFLHFKALTLFPYDSRSIEIGMLSPDELLQINAYHRMVYNALAPYLTAEEAEWLKAKTAQL
ncbi:MAG: aminopeptidase P family protein [Paludibacteraceae bacterium]|nr:aminopeptidase P family protein [Paludibacteraceae bacterium]